MISVTNIICIINLIAIVVLFILFFMKNKESFTGAPSGYTNLLVSDSDGNLNTYSTDTLKSAIQTMIDTSLQPYSKTQDIENNYYNKTYINDNYFTKHGMYSNYWNISQIREFTVLKSEEDKFVKIGISYPIKSMEPKGGYLGVGSDRRVIATSWDTLPTKRNINYAYQFEAPPDNWVN